jgi:hypothetical protein
MDNKKKVVTMTLDENGMKGVYAISFVDQPAIEEQFIALSKQTEVKLSADEERMMIYSPVLIPEQLILRVNRETEEPYYIKFPSDTIRAAAYAYLKQGNQHEHSFMHNFKVHGCTVVESWVKEGDADKSVHLGFELPIGTWFVGIKVDNKELWEKVKSGEVKGISIEGFFDTDETELSKLINELNSIEKELDKML